MANKPEPIILGAESLRSLIYSKYPEPSWISLSEIREGTGYNAGRSADVMSFGVWPSRGLEIIGFEIKCSRSDWTKELANPEKAEGLARYCNQWWLVTCDNVAKIEEIPTNWGWYTATKDGLKVMKQAVSLNPQEIERPLLMSIVRNISKNYVSSHLINQEIQRKAEELAKHRYDSREFELEGLRKLQKKYQEFVKISGIDFNNEWNYRCTPKQVGTAVKIILDGYLIEDIEKIKQAAEKAKEAAETLGKILVSTEKQKH